ncbi:hypothetical protein ACEYW6_20615 [Nostoc sp. UIC 10607]
MCSLCSLKKCSPKLLRSLSSSSVFSTPLSFVKTSDHQPKLLRSLSSSSVFSAPL